LVEAPRPRIGLEDPKVHATASVAGREPGPGPSHEGAPHAFAPMVRRDVQVVEDRAPPGILATVCADEAGHLALDHRHADELVGPRTPEPLAPHLASLRHQITVEKRVGKAASIRSPPAARVQLGDAVDVISRGDPVGLHLWRPSGRAIRHDDATAAHSYSRGISRANAVRVWRSTRS